MIINNNIPGLNAYNKMKSNNGISQKVMSRLSSGLRVNSAADDSAGLSISETMKAQIRGLQQAQRNIEDGISLIQTAHSGLAEIMDPNLIRLRELAVQASNGTLTEGDLRNIQMEVDSILGSINNIANNTEFNTIKLLNGAALNSQTQTDRQIPFDYKDVLKLPTPNANGLLNFSTNLGYPTTNDDDNKILDFGGGNTSWPSVIIDGKNYYLNGNKNNEPGVSVTIGQNAIVNNTYKTVFNIKNGTGIDVDVTQTVKVVADKYEIIYDIKNKGAARSVGFQFNLDTDVAQDDTAKFLVNNSAVTQEKLYSGSSNIPASFNVYNATGDSRKIEACGILKTQVNPYNPNIKYDIKEEPTKFGLGTWNKGVEKENWTPAAQAIGDSAYSIWWDNKTLAKDATRTINTFYGLSVPPTVTVPDPVVIHNPAVINIQSGPNSPNTFKIELSDVRTEKLFKDTPCVLTRNDAEKTIKYVDIAMETVSNEQTKYSGYNNALVHEENNASNYGENIQSAQSHIVDTDMAKDILESTKCKILNESVTAMMSQIKDMPQQILQIIAPKQK